MARETTGHVSQYWNYYVTGTIADKLKEYASDGWNVTRQSGMYVLTSNSFQDEQKTVRETFQVLNTTYYSIIPYSLLKREAQIYQRQSYRQNGFFYTKPTYPSPLCDVSCIYDKQWVEYTIAPPLTPLWSLKLYGPIRKNSVELKIQPHAIAWAAAFDSKSDFELGLGLSNTQGDPTRYTKLVCGRVFPVTP